MALPKLVKRPKRELRRTIVMVAVWWEDIVASSDKPYPLEPTVSAGFVSDEDEKTLVLACGVHADGEQLSFIRIPKSVIRSISTHKVKVPDWVREWHAKSPE